MPMTPAAMSSSAIGHHCSSPPPPVPGRMPFCVRRRRRRFRRDVDELAVQGLGPVEDDGHRVVGDVDLAQHGARAVDTVERPAVG